MKESQSIVVLCFFLVVVLIVTAGFVFKRAQLEINRIYVTPQEAKAMIEADHNLVVIDASPYFYEKGHLPGALNYPRCALNYALPGFDKDKTYLVYCHGFGTPADSYCKLKEAGIKNVHTLLGNYGAWVDAGYPVEN